MNSLMAKTKFSFLILLWVPLYVFSLRILRTHNPCDIKPVTTLRSDQLTVLINGYSESRIPLLLSISASYAASPIVSSVLVLWGNPSTSSETLDDLAYNLSNTYSAGARFAVIRQPSDSLNDRFLPRSEIKTGGVLICDDDVEVDSKSVEFAFQIWRTNQDRLIGMFARSHDLDLSEKTWMYTVQPDRYSILLTKFMMLKTEYLHQYTCKMEPEMRNIVDQMNNCEDILMNFVVADSTDSGPILVGAEKARDWGDARNDKTAGDGLSDNGERSTVSSVGLSSRVAEHRRRRGQCIRKFHKVLGRMALKYSYGKVVNSVGEQGLCEKGGKLVFCDQQIGH